MTVFLEEFAQGTQGVSRGLWGAFVVRGGELVIDRPGALQEGDREGGGDLPIFAGYWGSRRLDRKWMIRQ